MARESLPTLINKIPSNLPVHLRIQQQIRRRIKTFSRSSAVPCSYRHVLNVCGVVLCTVLLILLSKTLIIHKEVFDDVRDMQLVEEEDTLYLERKMNKTLDNNMDYLAGWNVTDIKIARTAWDYIYGEIVRKPSPPVITKYKSRLLRQLLARTRYNRVSKNTPALDVSCNYLNSVNDTGSPHAFTCASTSHRCPDGSFSPRVAFEPREGPFVTWDDVVIIIMVSAGREPFLEAAAETWISRLTDEASLFFVRDNGVPELPKSLLDRPNTFVFDFPGKPGLDNLDFKAFIAWSQAYSKFAASGKKYFLKLDDDAFLVGHHFIRFLNKLEHNFSGREEALYFGHPFCGHGDLKALDYGTWCYAGGGAYGMSIEALQIFVAQVRGGCAYFYDYIASVPDQRPEDDKYGGHYEDVMVGRCLRQARTRTQERGTSLIACGSFFPYAPLHYYERFGKSKKALSDKMVGDPITIHNLDPSAIRFLDHLLYEYPLGGFVTPFSYENEHLQELIDLCHMEGKKMVCEQS